MTTFILWLVIAIAIVGAIGLLVLWVLCLDAARQASDPNGAIDTLDAAPVSRVRPTAPPMPTARVPLRPSYPPQTRPRAVEPIKRSDEGDLLGAALLYGMVASVSSRADDAPAPPPAIESGQGGDFGGGGASGGWDSGSSDSSSSDSGSSSGD